MAVSSNLVGGFFSNPVTKQEIYKPIRSGAVYGPPMIAASVATAALTADTLYTHPIFDIPKGLYSAVIISIGTSTPGVSGIMGVYSNSQTLNIGELIEASPANINFGGSANTALVAVFTAPIILEGIIWPALICDGAAQPHTSPSSGLNNGGATQLYQSNSIAPYVRSVAATFTSKATAAAPFVSGFPQLPTLTFGTGAPGTPLMGLVAA